MNTAMVKVEEPIDSRILEAMVTRGDLSGLSPEQRVKHYAYVCDRLKLDPATQPFEYLRLNGKEIMYARKGCAEQLRQIHNISVEIVSKEVVGDLYVVTARAKNPDGRVDEDIGVVTILNLKGDNLANAMMKAHTKAKRRVTLSICGLGMPDESELETIESRLDAIPQEEQRPAVVHEIKRAASKPVEALPESFGPTMPIPASIRLWIRPLAGEDFDGPIQDLDMARLEAVVEHADRGYEATKNQKHVSAHARLILQQIAGSAQMVLDLRNGGAS